MPYDYVTLVDRAVNDIDHPREIFVNSQTIQLKAGQVEVVVPREVAMWVIRLNEKSYIHTTDGRYMCRYAMKDCPEDLLPFTGEEFLDTSPIENAFAAEGWNTGEVARPPGMKTVGPQEIVMTFQGPVRMPSQLTGISNQGAANPHVSVGGER